MESLRILGHLFATDEDCYRNSQPIKMQSPWVQYQRIHLQNIPSPKVQETWWRGGQKGSKSHRIRVCAVMLCLLLMLDTTVINSHQCNCPDTGSIRMTPVNMPKSAKKKDFSHTLRTIGNWGQLGTKEVAFIREEHTYWLSHAKFSQPWKCTY